MCHFNGKDEYALDEFIKNIPVSTESYETPHGFLIVCEHGFDIRALIQKWKDFDITIFRDGFLLLDMETKK